MKTTLVILTLNERIALEKIFDRIPFKVVDEVLAIDGNSKDGTIEFFKKKNIKVIVQEKKGRGEAFRIALNKAANEQIIFFSPDGNEDPNDIPKIKEELDNDFDIVIASRFMEGSRADDALALIPYRGYGNKFFTMLANIFFNGKLTDSINGFRGVKKEKIKKLNLDAEGYAIEYQMSIRALKRGYKIKEFPTFEGDRIAGKSGAKTISTGLYFLWILFRELLIGNKF